MNVFMFVKDIIKTIESFAPFAFQENYDNSGLILGFENQEVKKVLISLDCTEDVVNEAIDKGCNVIINHHPLIFSGIKRINGDNASERIIIKCLQNNISVIAVHTNLDNSANGLNKGICDLLGLKNTKILQPLKGVLKKLVTFCPIDYADKVRQTIFEAGAGHIGNYDCCSYNIEGKGTFRGLENTKPFVGETGKLHNENEVRIETIYPSYLQNKVISALLQVHPYEEVAYDIYLLDNAYENAGAGMYGEFENPLSEKEFLIFLKEKFNLSLIRHSEFLNKSIKKVAVCGGSGSFLIKQAMNKGVDAFVTADIKYHQFFEPEKKFLLADIGHYESEKISIEILYQLIIKNFTTFAVLKTQTQTNGINYFF